MFSSFSKLLPTNVNITTPDFLKSVTNNTNHSPEPTSSSTDAKHRNVLTKQHKSPAGDAPESHTSTLETASVNESENAHIVDNTESKHKNESRSKRRKDATATETFYIVRPPPSKTNHPLNLQVQLLATSGRERVERRRASGSSTRSEPGANDLGLTRTTTGSRETLNDTEEGNGLKRTASIRSTRSDTESVYSAASTGSTIASVTSSSSGRRMIPLYNLNAHNVMTNSIADAGTDAKIAKFFKRGLEIMGLAVLEPAEVYGKYAWDDAWDSLYPTGRGAAVSRTVSHISNWSMQRAVSPSGSGIFPSNNGDLEPVMEIPASPTTPKAPNSSTDKDVGKKLFGGIFNKKKKEPPAPLPLGQTSSRDTASTENGGMAIRSPKHHSANPSASIASPLPTVLNIPETPTTSTTAAEVQLQPQILGLQAVLQSPMVPPKGRPSAYVWVVRRWIRGADEGFLGIGAMVESLNLGMNNTEKCAPHGMEVEVRFEWKRCAKGKTGAPAKEREKDKHTRRHSIAVEGGSAVPIGVPTTHGLLDPSSAMDNNASSSPSSKRLSFQGFGFGKKSPQITPPDEHANGSHDHLKVSRAPSPNPPASITTVGTNEESTTGGGGATGKSAHQVIVEDDESDSDIEDSERPWNCYLHIRAPPSSRASSRDELATPLNPHSHGGDTGRSSRSNKEKTLDIRLRIAALAPAPHHPKVIAQIKTPYPLPDVLFDAHKTTAELRTRGENESLSNLAESISSASGGGGGGARGAKPVVLSCEDVKDVVSCTGLWLVVREGYGGLARKRKGDGWRLRG